MKKLIILSIFLLVQGCASTKGIRVVEPDSGRIPDGNEVRRLSAGEVLYAKYSHETTTVAEIPSEFKIGFMASGVATDDLVLTKLAEELAYCGPFSSLTPGYATPSFGCFVDSDQDSRFESIIYSGAKVSLAEVAAYTTKKKMLSGFRKEILFQGRTEKTLKFKYREFSNDLIRAAFAQDIEYFLSPDGSTSGSFKGLKIDVLSTDGNYIEYQVTGDIE